tara:strand:+ start:998 stop:1840 length:843 start_codon:yes stop_codon:yes gene_type:complete
MNNTNTKIIKVSGKNIENFFQNIITNDINSLNKKTPLYTAMLSPQGKYLHDFIMLKDEGFYLLEANQSNIELLVKEIKKYDIRNDIFIEVQNDIYTKVIIKENLNRKFLKKIGDKKIYRDKKFLCLIDPRSENFLYRFWINEKLNELAEFIFSDESEVEEKRIYLKIPNSEIDLVYNKSFILNYNFENIKSLSFNKGCYIGQENTAKQKFRGTQKYSLQKIKITDGVAPKLNEDIFFNGFKIGTMKSSCAKVCLCLIRNDTINNNTKTITTDNNFTFEIL